MVILIIMLVVIAVLVAFLVFRSRPSDSDEPVERYTCDVCGDMDCVCHKEDESMS